MDHFLVTNISDPQMQGSASSLVVMAQDALNYIYREYSGTVCFKSSDSDAILPRCYKFNPFIDKGMHTFTNAVSFKSTGEKIVEAYDIEDNYIGMQANITVAPGLYEQVNHVVFANDLLGVNIGEPNYFTVNLKDSNMRLNNTLNGYKIRLTSTSPTGLFSLNTEEGWSSVGIFTVPANLSSLNIYYKDISSGRHNIQVSDWQGNYDDPFVLNDDLEVVVNSLSVEASKIAKSHSARNFQWVDNKFVFANTDNGLNQESEQEFIVSVKDDSTNELVDANVSFVLKNSRGEIVNESTTFVKKEEYPYQYILKTYANIPDDSGLWQMEITAVDANNIKGYKNESIDFSDWRVEINYSIGYLQKGLNLPINLKIWKGLNLVTPDKFSIYFIDNNGNFLEGFSPLEKTQMTKVSEGEFNGEMLTSGLTVNQMYHLFVVVKDDENNILAEDSHGDVQLVNNPALAPKDLTIEKIVRSVENNKESYNLKFKWDAAEGALNYNIYRSQDKFTQLYHDPCTITQVQNGDRESHLCETIVEMKVGLDDREDWVLSGSVPFAQTEFILENAEQLPGKDYFFIVRAENELGESGLSTMVFSSKRQYFYNSEENKSNINWISLPYTPGYFTNPFAGLNKTIIGNASEIVKDMEGGIGQDKNQKVKRLSLWNPVIQSASESYYYRAVYNSWINNDFQINPGSGLFLEHSGKANVFDWTIVGKDEKINKSFFCNGDSSKSNVNWIALPYSGMYKKASDIVKDIEGGMGKNTNQRIKRVSLWNPVIQSASESYYYRAAYNNWIGEDFDVEPGDGVFIELSCNNLLFNWKPALIIEPNE